MQEEKPIQTLEEAKALIDKEGGIHNYDTYIVYFSGGKDSIACFLYLLEKGIPKDKIELWHHDIDGREGSSLMDWGCTADYCRKFAQSFGVKIYFSWREGGFEREMLRNNQTTGDIFYEVPDGNGGARIVQKESRQGERYQNTRRKFPQVSADLSVRWCSAYLKIDVGASAIRGQERFNDSKTLVLTGERGEESSARSKYNLFEPDRADLRKGKKARLVDHLRPIRDWEEQKVWDIIEEYRINPHPAYKLGFGRVSCANCIFGNADQFATTMAIMPEATQKISDYENEFGVTIKRKDSIEDLIAKGSPYPNMKPEDIEQGNNKVFSQSIILPQGVKWILPQGAFGESCGPI